ncbi:MAG: amidase [Rhodospirillales bacterium]|nr:amidase [Rhodospirillales bacterium]
MIGSVAPHWMEAGEAARGFAEGRFSPTELMAALLERIARLDPALGVFVHLDAERAMEAARGAETAIAAGRIRGKLRGVPVAVKDMIDVGGMPTTCQSRLLAGAIAPVDAACVAKLRQAGAIILGKVATHEFALGGAGPDLPFPPARNPWHPDHTPGGSSSGSGAGLAAGLFPLALGTDSGGSARHPAGACGVVGLKPTYGLISRRGVFPLAFTLDHVGPMARSVADAALLLECLAGPDPQDPGSATPPRAAPGAGLEAGVRGLRIGFVRHFHETDMPADPEVASGLESVARALAADGAELVPVSLPPLGEFSAVNRIIMAGEAWAVHAPWLRTRPGEYGRIARQRLMSGAFLAAGDYIDAQRRRSLLIAAVETALREVDVLLCASSMDPPPRLDDAALLARADARQSRTPFNVTGHPALAMASGLSRAGLPLSVQFAGRYFDEATVLRTARTWERAGETRSLHPPLA